MHGSIGKLFLNTKMHVTYTIQSSDETSLSGEGISNNWQLYSTYVSWMREGERWRRGGREGGRKEGGREEESFSKYKNACNVHNTELRE